MDGGFPCRCDGTLDWPTRPLRREQTGKSPVPALASTGRMWMRTSASKGFSSACRRPASANSVIPAGAFAEPKPDLSAPASGRKAGAGRLRGDVEALSLRVFRLGRRGKKARACAGLGLDHTDDDRSSAAIRCKG